MLLHIEVSHTFVMHLQPYSVATRPISTYIYVHILFVNKYLCCQSVSTRLSKQLPALFTIVNLHKYASVWYIVLHHMHTSTDDHIVTQRRPHCWALSSVFVYWYEPRSPFPCSFEQLSLRNVNYWQCQAVQGFFCGYHVRQYAAVNVLPQQYSLTAYHL